MLLPLVRLILLLHLLLGRLAVLLLLVWLLLLLVVLVVRLLLLLLKWLRRRWLLTARGCQLIQKGLRPWVLRVLLKIRLPRLRARLLV